MNTIFGEITKPFIKAIFAKNNTSVLVLIMFYDKRGDNPKKAFRFLSCVVYSIINIYFYIDFMACLSKTLSEIPVGYRGGSKYGDRSFIIILRIGIPVH